MSIKQMLKNTKLYDFYRFRLRNNFYIRKQKKYGDEYLIKSKWRKVFHRELDLNNPKTLNEKLQWLKLNDYKPEYTVWADKYGCRKYIEEHFGKEYLVPLIFHTDNMSEINEKNINEFPCVIKPNHSSAAYMIIRDGSKINWKRLRLRCKRWIGQDYYCETQEKQYKDMKRYIVVEKMLQTKEGKIPNDYKLHFIEGKLVFIYCSIDREGDNYRQIFDKDWNLLPFSWEGHPSGEDKHKPIEKPKTFEKMVEIGKYFAEKTHYIRVDFYDVDGKLYCGEVTLYHGSGLDRFNPDCYDFKYGEMVKLPLKSGQ